MSTSDVEMRAKLAVQEELMTVRAEQAAKEAESSLDKAKVCVCIC